MTVGGPQLDPERWSGRTARWGAGLPTTATGWPAPGPLSPTSAPTPSASTPPFTFNPLPIVATDVGRLRPRPRPGGGGRAVNPVTPSGVGGRRGSSSLPGGANRNDLYGGYTSAQLLADPSLVSRLGGHAAVRWAARPGTTPGGGPIVPPGAAGPMPQGPTAGPPVGSIWPPAGPPLPPPSGPPFMPGAPGMPPVVGGGFGGQDNDFLDPIMQFLSAVPVMRHNTSRAIADAMAQAGGTGNRWGTSAQRTAGQIGAESAMSENALLTNLLADFANRSEDRALQATGQATNFGALMDQLARNRIEVPFGVGQYEQGRQDDIARLLFGDWSANRLGWLGPMLQFAGSQGAGSPGSPGQIIQVPGEAAKPGAIDWARVLAEFFG